jgi:hypothetical protein
MKQLLLAVFILTALIPGTFAYSNHAKPVKTTTKEISISSAFEKIQVGNNIQLVLTQTPNNTGVIVKGDEKFIPNVNVSIDNGVLSITSKRNLKDRRVKIYVPVTTLTSLELGREASVTTKGAVKLDNLTVIVNDGSTVALDVIGNLHIEPAAGCDFVYEKFEKSNVGTGQE